MSRSAAFKWGLSFLFPLIAVFLAQYSPALQPKAVTFFALTIFIASIWAFDLLPATVASIGLCVLYILLGVATPKDIFSSWGSTVPWITVGGLIFAAVVHHSGLARRIALRCILLVGCSMTRLFCGLALSGFILSFLIPSITARVVIYTAIGVAFCQSLELDRTSRAASAIILMCYAAGGHFCQAIYTATNVSLIMVAHLQKGGFPLTFFDFFKHNILISIPYGILSIVMARMLMGHQENLRKEVLHDIVKARLAELGPMTFTEIKALLLLVTGMTIFATEHLHKLPGAYIFLATALLSFAPGVNLLDEKGFSKLNFSVIIFIACCMGIASAAQSSGADTWIVAQLLPIVSGGSGMFITLCSYLFGVVVNFILTPVAAVSSMDIPLIELAAKVGVKAPGILYAYMYGLDQYIFPYEYAPLLYLFTSGYITLRHVMGYLAVRIVIVGALLAAAYPLWSLMGAV